MKITHHANGSDWTAYDRALAIALAATRPDAEKPSQKPAQAKTEENANASK